MWPWNFAVSIVDWLSGDILNRHASQQTGILLKLSCRPTNLVMCFKFLLDINTRLSSENSENSTSCDLKHTDLTKAIHLRCSLALSRQLVTLFQRAKSFQTRRLYQSKFSYLWPNRRNSALYRKSGSWSTTVTSDFWPEVEIWPFCTCAMRNMQFNH